MVNLEECRGDDATPRRGDDATGRRRRLEFRGRLERDLEASGRGGGDDDDAPRDLLAGGDLFDEGKSAAPSRKRPAAGRRDAGGPRPAVELARAAACSAGASATASLLARLFAARPQERCI